MAELDLMKDENTELTDQQMDELVSKADNKEPRGKEIPMTADAPTPEPAPDLIEFTHNGKKIKGTRDQLIKWAQQGIDYPQRAQKLNQEKAQWDQSRQQWEQQWGSYKQIDDWAKQNPDKWTQLQQSWQNAQNGQSTQPTQNDPYLTKFQTLEQRLAQLEPLIQTTHQKLTVSEQQAEDHALDQQIQSLREKYKDIDWDTPDDNGKPLEYKVLEFASESGLKNFDTAFKAFYHDELVKRAEALAKQNVSKDIQTKSKLGILGSTPTPKRGIQAVKDVKTKSYEDIMSEIREERAQGLYG